MHDNTCEVKSRERESRCKWQQKKLPPFLLLSPVSLGLVVLGSGLVDLGVQPFQLVRGGVGLCSSRRRGGRTVGERLWRWSLVEVVDAGVRGVEVVVLHFREGAAVRGGVARADLGIARIMAVRTTQTDVVLSYLKSVKLYYSIYFLLLTTYVTFKL